MSDELEGIGSVFDDFANALKALPLRQEAEIRAYLEEMEIHPRLKAAGFLRRFWASRENELTSDQIAVRDRCLSKCCGVGAIIVLAGTRGGGKTTVCAEIAKMKAGNASLPPWERQPPYRKMVDLVAYYKPLYADFGSVSTDALLASRDALAKHKLLMIDEIHGCDDQKMKDRFLTDILDQRYARMVDTILVTNQSASDFRKTTNDSIRSRISEHGQIIPCDWPSFRTQ